MSILSTPWHPASIAVSQIALQPYSTKMSWFREQNSCLAQTHILRAESGMHDCQSMMLHCGTCPGVVSGGGVVKWSSETHLNSESHEMCAQACRHPAPEGRWKGMGTHLGFLGFWLLNRHFPPPLPNFPFGHLLLLRLGISNIYRHLLLHESKCFLSEAAETHASTTLHLQENQCCLSETAGAHATISTTSRLVLSTAHDPAAHHKSGDLPFRAKIEKLGALLQLVRSAALRWLIALSLGVVAGVRCMRGTTFSCEVSDAAMWSPK